MINTTINGAEIELALSGDFQTVTAETVVFLKTVADEMEKHANGSGDMYLYFIQQYTENLRRGKYE